LISALSRLNIPKKMPQFIPEQRFSIFLNSLYVDFECNLVLLQLRIFGIRLTKRNMKISDSSNSTIPKKEWLVVYTRSKCEKKADALLKLQGITSFCPLITSKRKWADRVKTIESPLFNSYLFVCVNYREHLKVLQTQGIMNFVHYCGKPAVVPSDDMERIKNLIQEYPDLEAVSINTVTRGAQVTINDGILFELNGEVLEVQGKHVLVMIKQLDCALIARVKVEMDHLLLERPAKY
jgi:transcription antitermination factor NusG